MAVPDKKRIKEFNSLNREKNKQLYKKAVLMAELEEVDNKIISVDDNIKKWGIRCYRDADEREKILNEAEKCGFSIKTIEVVRKCQDCWNDDIISTDIVKEFPKMEIRIKENEQNNSIKKVVGDLLEKIGTEVPIGGASK